MRFEIDITALGIGVDELDGDSVADVEAFATANQHAFDVRIERADEGALFRRACDNGLISLADVRMKNNRGDAFLHLALDFAGGVFHLGASLRDGVEVVFRVGLCGLRKPRFEDALRDDVGEAAVGRGGMRVVLTARPKWPGEGALGLTSTYSPGPMSLMTASERSGKWSGSFCFCARGSR